MKRRFTLAIAASFASAIALAPTRVRAEQITQAQRDSGWVSAFDGKTLNGFYTTLGTGAPNNDPVKNPDGTFSVRASDSSIHASGSPTGHIITKQLYSHYRVRIREKFDVAGNPAQNAGMLYHARIEAPRLGAYPRSIEYQGQKRGMGEIWTISKVWVNTTIDSTLAKHQFKLGGKMVNHGNPDGRQCLGSSVPFKDGEWNVMEATVRGSDSAIHYVNGVLVFKCWKMRWSDTDDPADMSHPLAEGSIALQSEGAGVAYRDYMFMELDPATGRPLHGVPTLAGRFRAAGKGNLLRESDRSGGWVIASGLPSPDWEGITLRSVDGKLMPQRPSSAAAGAVYWKGAR